MKLMVSERGQLFAALSDAFRTIQHFEQLARRLGINPDDFRPGEGVSVRLNTLIDNYEAHGLIEKLFEIPTTVQGWEENSALKIALQGVRDSYKRREGAPTLLNRSNPFERCFLDQGRPFIDRQLFRDYLRELNRPGSKRFLVVNGPVGSGKSHSYYLIEALALVLNFKFCYIDIEQEICSRYYPDIMARRIDRDLTLPDTQAMPVQENVGDRWAQELCDWLVHKLRKDSSTCWIVLDGFADSDLPDETTRMLSSLIDAVDKRLPQVRIVLLDYPASLPPKLRPFVRTETIQEVEQADLEAFFRKAFEQARIEYTDHLVQEAAAKILQDIQVTQDKRMLEIMHRVMDLAEQIPLVSELR